MITIQIDGKKYIPSETLGGITRVPEMIQHYIEFGALEEVKENKEPTVHIPNDGKKYMINGELYNPQANSILEKLRKELEKMKTENTDTSDEYTQGVLNTCDYLLELLTPLEQPKEEPQPQEDIELTRKVVGSHLKHIREGKFTHPINTMTNKTTRENFEILLRDKYPEICMVFTHNLGWFYQEPKELWSFISQVEDEALQRGREEMRNNVKDMLERQAMYPGGHSMGPRMCFCEDFIKKLQSL